MGHSLYGLKEDTLKAADPTVVFTQGEFKWKHAHTCTHDGTVLPSRGW